MRLFFLCWPYLFNLLALTVLLWLYWRLTLNHDAWTITLTHLSVLETITLNYRDGCTGDYEVLRIKIRRNVRKASQLSRQKKKVI